MFSKATLRTSSIFPQLLQWSSNFSSSTTSFAEAEESVPVLLETRRSFNCPGSLIRQGHATRFARSLAEVTSLFTQDSFSNHALLLSCHEVIRLFCCIVRAAGRYCYLRNLRAVKAYLKETSRFPGLRNLSRHCQ